MKEEKKKKIKQGKKGKEWNKRRRMEISLNCREKVLIQ
jgi:hypothetical protein